MLQKTGLLLSDYYGRLLVAVRCAELLDAAEAGGEGPIELRVEVQAHHLWDDLVEVRRDSASRETTHGWQVKRQRTGLDKEVMAEQLRALAGSSLHMAHLALLSLEPVKKVGSLHSLAELCERLRQPQLDLRTVLEGMPDVQRKWVDFAKREVPLATDEACLELFRRLEVKQLGTESELRLQALKDLRHWYEEPEAVLAKILDFLARYPDEAVPVDHALLRDEVLRGHTPSPRRSRTFTELRESYLRELVRGHERLAPLRTLVAGGDEEGPAIRVADVYVPPVLREVRTRPRANESETEVPTPRLDEPFAGDPRSRRYRLLHQQRAQALQRRAVDVLEGLLAPETLPSRVLLIEGAVGSGKSLLLEYLRQALAQEGLRNPAVPLPILLDAQDLAREGLSGAFKRRSPLDDERLLAEDGQKRVFFVDGRDEVDPRDLQAFALRLDQLNQDRNTVATVLASRPIGSESLVQSAVRLRIAPWTEQDVEQFLERWRQFRPEHVASLGNAWRNEPMRSALAHPLTATFSLLLAEEKPESRGSRTALFEGIVSKLVKNWAAFRKARGSPGATPSWAELAKPIQKLALEVVQSERETLGERDVRKLLRSIDPDRDQDWMDAASLHFGLLVQQGRSEYRFVLRGIAEYLAGDALYRQGAHQILAAVRQRWAEEPVRHAIGITAERDGPEAAIQVLRRLLPKDRFHYQGEMLVALRAVLIAARVALDLGPAAQPIAEELAAHLLFFLTLATSTWIPERVSEVVRELARAQSPCWDALFPKLRERLDAPGTYADWLASQPWDDWRRWLEQLRVSDPHARNVVTARLERWVDVPNVREALVLQFFDDVGDIPEMDLAGASVTAGLALRKAARDDKFTRWLQPRLIEFLRLKHVMISRSAALALRPGEADPELLVEGLRTLSSGHGCPQEVLEELAASPEGRAALDSLWPDWPTESRALPFRRLEEAPRLPEGSPVPIPSSLGAVLLQVTAPMFARMMRPGGTSFGSIEGMPMTEVLCGEAVDHPQGVISVLSAASGLMIFHVDAQFALREAASRHPELARALLGFWKRLSTQEEQSHYPGIALDFLVAAGDDEAAEAFASWLGLTQIFGIPAPVLPISVKALRHPKVLPVALARAREAWRTHIESNLWMGSVASCLGSLRPAWEDDAFLNDALRKRAPELDDRSLSPLLDVFGAAPFPEWLRELLLSRLEARLEEPREDNAFMVPRWLDWAERTGDAVQFRAQLESWAGRESWERYSAAAMLLGMYSPSEAGALSQRMAEAWPSGWNSYVHVESELARLAIAHPQSWYARLDALLGPRAFDLLLNGVPVFELVRVLLPRLRADERTKLLVKVAKTLASFEFPWLSARGQWGQARRPADFFQEISFDSGSW